MRRCFTYQFIRKSNNDNDWIIDTIYYSGFMDFSTAIIEKVQKEVICKLHCIEIKMSS